MELVKKNKDHVIFKKKSGRYAVKNSRGKWVNGEDKVKFLLASKLIKVTPTKKKAEAEPAAEESADAKTEEAAAKVEKSE